MSTTGDAWLIQVMGYVPNVPAAAIFCLLYGLISLVFLWRTFALRTAFTVILVITGLVECIGYGTRIEVSNNPGLGIYIISTLFILLAPNALALVNYKVLGQLIVLKQPSAHLLTGGTLMQRTPAGATVSSRLRLPYLVDSSTGLIRGERVSKLFFATDIISFLIQAAGGGQSAQQSTADMGQTIMLIGLIFQTAAYLLFALLAIYVYRSPLYNQMPSADVEEGAKCSNPNIIVLDETAKLASAFRGLFWTIGLLALRNIYRLIEDIDGRTGYFATHEAYILVFDGTLILLTFIAFWYYNLDSSLTLMLRRRHQLADGTSGVDASQLHIADREKASESAPTKPLYPEMRRMYSD